MCSTLKCCQIHLWVHSNCNVAQGSYGNVSCVSGCLISGLITSVSLYVSGVPQTMRWRQKIERIHEYQWKDWPDPALKLWRKFKGFLLRTLSDAFYKTVAAEFRGWRILPNLSLWLWDGKVKKHSFTLCHLQKKKTWQFQTLKMETKQFFSSKH